MSRQAPGEQVRQSVSLRSPALRKGIVRARANTATTAGFVPATVGPPSVKKRFVPPGLLRAVVKTPIPQSVPWTTPHSSGIPSKVRWIRFKEQRSSSRTS